jgi:hypothetical protein
VYYSISGVPVLAKYVPNDTFVFDDTVKKNEASYLVSYTPLPSQSEADTGLTDSTEKKIPFAITLASMFVVCSLAWAGIAFIIFKLLGH